MQKLGNVMAKDTELLGLHADIATKEAELQELQKVAWERRNVLMRESEKLSEGPKKQAKVVSFEGPEHEV